ncbi:MAG: hypothetical protein HYU28_02740 [Actinobacteria bacterium]|nr:hypothetical protein [Actinomycetota bacterium]
MRRQLRLKLGRILLTAASSTIVLAVLGDSLPAHAQEEFASDHGCPPGGPTETRYAGTITYPPDVTCEIAWAGGLPQEASDDAHSLAPQLPLVVEWLSHPDPEATVPDVEPGTLEPGRVRGATNDTVEDAPAVPGWWVEFSRKEIARRIDLAKQVPGMVIRIVGNTDEEVAFLADLLVEALSRIGRLVPEG